MNMFYIFSIKMDLTLDKNGTGKMTTVTSSMFDEDGPSTETSTFEFYVKKGSLYIKNDEYPDFQKIGEIDTFKLEMQEPEETEGEAYTFTLKNNSAIKLQKTSIILMIVFASTAALCGAYFIVEKILAKRKSKTSEVETETLENPLQPNETQE